MKTCHVGERQPSKSSPSEIDTASSREPGYRMPRITAELIAARPVDISFIDGVETIAAGEGPWIKGIRFVEPKLLILGTNAVSTDTVGDGSNGLRSSRTARHRSVYEVRQHAAARRIARSRIRGSEANRGPRTLSSPRRDSRSRANKKRQKSYGRKRPLAAR